MNGPGAAPPATGPGRAARGWGDRDNPGGDQPAVPDVQHAEGAAGLAAAVGGRAGIEDPLPVPGVVERDMRVTEDDEFRTGELAAHPGRAAGRRARVVDHRHRQPVQVQLQRVRRAPGGHVRAVVVAADGPDRGVAGQLVQDARGAHVARVQDEVRATQLLRHRRRAGPPAARRVRVGQHDHLHEPILPGAWPARLMAPGRIRPGGAVMVAPWPIARRSSRWRARR